MKTSVEWLENQIKNSKYYFKLMADINSRSTIVQPNIFEQAKEMENEKKHESIEKQVSILKGTLEEMMTGFDSEEDRIDFILDICNGYKKRINN